MRTFEKFQISDVLDRTKQDDDGCLIWQLGAVKGVCPVIRIDGMNQSVRRVIFKAIHGRLTQRLQIRTRCEKELCVHPDCLYAARRADILKGRKLSAASQLKMTQTQRKKSTLVNADIVKAIRESTETSAVIAAQYGLKPRHARSIRSHECWHELTSPFSGLGARA